jgi:hypothetical protein
VDGNALFGKFSNKGFFSLMYQNKVRRLPFLQFSFTAWEGSFTDREDPAKADGT